MENIIVDKSKRFAVNIIYFYKFLVEQKKEFVISKQLLRSGTSIGANVKEANCSMSKKEFIAKLNISLKEASETEYWLEILVESKIITNEMFIPLYKDCQELLRILTAIIKSSNTTR